MTRYKRWMIAGGITGTLATTLFVALTTMVLASDPAMSHVVVLSILNVLLGMISICLIVGGNMCRWIAETSDEAGKQRWWRGYSAAVEDLKTDAQVFELPVPTSRNGRHG